MDSKCIWCGKEIWGWEQWEQWDCYNVRIGGYSPPEPIVCECYDYVDMDISMLEQEDPVATASPVVYYTRQVEHERKVAAWQ